MRQSKQRTQVVSDQLIIAVLKVLLQQFERRVKIRPSNDEDSMGIERRQLRLWDDQTNNEGEEQHS